MKLAQMLDFVIGRVRILDDDSGKLICEFDICDKDRKLDPALLSKTVNYISSNLRYFCNSKHAEYSAAINIYIF